MSMTDRELWAVIHGLVLGTLFLLAFAGGLAELYSLRTEWVTAAGIKERIRRLSWGNWLMAVVAWLTCISGTYIVYPWYRAAPPEGQTDLADFPRSLLLADASLKAWHSFGMEWKEHVAWFAPLLATAVAYVVWRYRARLSTDAQLRNMLIVLFILAFVAAGVAGLFGAFITKAAPVA